jgi:hypothetical protein
MDGLTREQVEKAVNAGADLVLDDDQIGGSDRDRDLVNLVCNAILSLLDEPGLTLDEVIERNWDGEEADGDEPAKTAVEVVRGWWGDWS